jgi:hypothetical protein
MATPGLEAFLSRKIFNPEGRSAYCAGLEIPPPIELSTLLLAPLNGRTPSQL